MHSSHRQIFFCLYRFVLLTASSVSNAYFVAYQLSKKECHLIFSVSTTSSQFPQVLYATNKSCTLEYWKMKLAYVLARHRHIFC
jgi:hypothetical protein